MTKNKKNLFTFNEKVKGVKMIDQNYLNNGGHNEYIIVKFGGHKSTQPKYCVIEYDIYGKSKSYILTQEEVINEFGNKLL